MNEEVQNPEVAEQQPVEHQIRNLNIQIVDGKSVNIVLSEVTALELRTIAELLHAKAGALINGGK